MPILATWSSSTSSNQAMPWAARTQLRPGAKPAPTTTGASARRSADWRPRMATVSARSSRTMTVGRPAATAASAAASCVPRGEATTTTSASIEDGKGWC